MELRIFTVNLSLEGNSSLLSVVHAEHLGSVVSTELNSNLRLIFVNGDVRMRWDER